MKIMHLTHTKLSRDYRIINELRSIACLRDWRLYATTSETCYRENLPQDYREQIGAIEIVSLPQWYRRSTLWSFLFDNIYMLFILFKVKPQVVHFHDTYFIPAVRTAMLFGLSSRFIYDSHELNELRAATKGWYTFLSLHLEKSIWSSIHAVITVNRGITDYLMLRHGTCLSEEILNIPWSYNSVSNASRKKVSMEKIQVCFVGNLVSGRDLERIVSFFVTNMEFDLHIFGSGELENSLQEIAGQSDNIYFHGFIEPKLLSEKLSFMHIGLSLISGDSYSQYLALPNKIFDFLTNGLSVISYPNPEIVRYMRGDPRLLYINKNYMSSELRDVLDTYKGPKYVDGLSLPDWHEQGERILNLYT